MSDLVCTGRAHNDQGQPTSEPCGRSLPRLRGVWLHDEGDADYEARARARGWKLGPTRADGGRDVMCPTCGRPDPATAATIRDIERSLP